MKNEKASNSDNWLRDIVENNSPKLTRYAISLVYYKEPADDCVQETFIRLSRQKRSKVEDHLQPWLFKVCRNQCIDYLRRHKKMSMLEESTLEKQEDTAKGPREKAENKEQGQQVLDLADKLPVAQREVIRLKFQAGLSYKEIAETTNRSVSNVGVLLHTALLTLRKQLKNDSEVAGI